MFDMFFLIDLLTSHLLAFIMADCTVHSNKISLIENVVIWYLFCFTYHSFVSTDDTSRYCDAVIVAGYESFDEYLKSCEIGQSFQYVINILRFMLPAVEIRECIIKIHANSSSVIFISISVSVI